MSDSDRETLGLANSWEESLESRSSLEKVYHVALQLYDPTSVAAVAERADVAPATAEKYLNFFVEVGMLRETGDESDMYTRNTSYFEWRETDRLRRTHSVAELQERVSELTTIIQEFKQQYDAASPAAVDPRTEGYENVDTILEDLRAWQDAQAEIDRIVAVLKLDTTEKTDDLVSAIAQELLPSVASIVTQDYTETDADQA